jgi:ATP-binding cassette subfamily B protein
MDLFKRAKRVPYVRQLTSTDCGAACLAMTLAYYGRAVKLADVRDFMGTGRDGTTPAAMDRAADHFGLRMRLVRAELGSLADLPAGTILHWDFSHYVVLERVRRRSVLVVDPAVGRRELPMKLVSKAFTGVAILFEPHEPWTGAEAPRGIRWGYARRISSQRGTLAKVLAASFLIQSLSLALPLVMRTLIDRVIPARDLKLLTIVILAALTFVGFSAFVTLVRAHLLLKLRTELDKTLTLAFLEHLFRLPFPFFQQRTAGDLMMRLQSNAAVREILASGAMSAVLDGVWVLVYLVLLLATSLLVGALAVGLALLQLLLFLLSRGRQRALAMRTLEVDARLRNYEVEMLGGVETLKSMGAEARALSRWSGNFAASMAVTIERGKLDATFDSASGLLGMASPLIIIAGGAYEALSGRFSLGTMLELAALAGGFLVPIGKLVGTAYQLQRLPSFLERLNDVFETAPEPSAGQVLAHPLCRSVTLEAVSFRYSLSSEEVIRDVSLEIPAGATIAIVGESGCGKSTLTKILLGLYTPTSGRVLWDGADLTTIDPRSLRRLLGIVTQDSALFSGTIRDNIALSMPGASIDDIERAAKLACVHDEVLAMPMRYNTLLQNGGGGVSGGQRQRIALARALLTRPEMLVLDEATSALDAATEERVIENLRQLRVTRVTIAHRLSTIRSADRIFVLRQGRLVEEGSYQKLAELQGELGRLLAAQGSS